MFTKEILHGTPKTDMGGDTLVNRGGCENPSLALLRLRGFLAPVWVSFLPAVAFHSSS